MKKFLLSFICIGIIFYFHSECFSKGVGTTGAQFLKITQGVRPNGMGNAFVGVADDINSINYNPSGLGFLSDTEILLTHNQWIEEINIEHIAASHKINSIGTIGFSGTMLTMGNIDKYDNTGTALNETFTASDISIGLSYSRLINDKTSVGLVLKYIQQKIEKEQATALGTDIGILYRGITVAEKVLPIGFAIKNVGTEIKFREEGSPLPMIVSVGVSYEPLKSLISAVDIRYSNEQQVSFALGIEKKVLFKQIGLNVRAGYDTAVLQSQSGGLAGLSAGLGIETKLPLGIDFSWTPQGDVFGNTYRFGLTVKLGK
ncbi:MAG: PorV/PorQ family protein [Endomicrobiia bacterium]